MSAWPNAQLGNIAEVIAGQSPEGKFYNKNQNGLPFYQGKKDFGTSYLGAPSSWTTVSTKISILGDIVMSVRAPVGPVNLTTEKCCIGRGLAAIRPGEKLERDFLFYYLQSVESSLSGSEGAVFPSINKEQIKALSIPLPPLDEQKRIVAKLDEAQAQFERLSNNLDLQVVAISDFGSALLNESMTSSPMSEVHSPSSSAAASLTADFAVSGWPTESLDVLCTRGILQLGRGNIISKKDIAAYPGNYPIYSSAAKNNGMFGMYGKYMFDEEMITWSIDGGGRLFFRDKHKFSVTNVGGTLRVLDKSVFDTRFLYYVLSYLHSLVRFDWVAKAHPSVIRIIYDSVPLPPLDEQKRIVAKLEAAQREQVSLSEKLDERKALVLSLKDKTLVAAFAGDL